MLNLMLLFCFNATVALVEDDTEVPVLSAPVRSFWCYILWVLQVLDSRQLADSLAPLPVWDWHFW